MAFSRRKLYEIVEQAKSGDTPSLIYDIFMIVVVVISLIPLGFKERPYIFDITDLCTALIFAVDYLFRWVTADYRLKSKSVLAFIRYPFTLTAIMDLLTILPAFTILGDYFKLFRIVRMVRTLRLLKLLNLMKAFRYSKTLKIIGSVIRNSKEALIVVASFACFYILISALLIFKVEPDTFNSFFDAIYWATVSLTTVGYGDLYPVTTIGKAISMISSFLGIAIIALPASIITAGYMKALDEYINEKKNNRERGEQQ